MMVVSVEAEPALSLGTPEEVFKSNYLGMWDVNGFPFDMNPDGDKFLMMVGFGTNIAGSIAELSSSKKINIVLNWFEELKERVPVD